MSVSAWLPPGPMGIAVKREGPLQRRTEYGGDNPKERDQCLT